MKGNLPYFVFIISLLQLNSASDIKNTIRKHKSFVENVSPDAPVINVYAVSSCALQVTFDCSKNCSENLNSFEVYWQKAGSEDSYSASIGRLSNSYNIENLNADQLYTVWVAAVKDDGEHNSEPKETSTYPGEPQVVIGVETFVLSDANITVSWEKTTNPCPIKGYSITWNGTALWDELLKPTGNHNVGYETTNYEVSYLTPYTEYDFYVSEITTDNILGEPSYSSRATTEEGTAGPPESLTSTVLSSSSIEINWTPPVEANGVITGYHISCRHFPDTEDLFDATTDEYGRYFVPTGLKACAEYTFKVYAINGAGSGKASTSVSTTKPDAPPNFANFQAIDVRLASANLTWNPLDTNCPVLYYNLHVLGNILWINQTYTFDIDFRSENNFYLLEDLIQGTSYSVSITATTDGGSTDSVSTEFQTLQDNLEAPVIEEVTNISPCSLTIIWSCTEKCLDDLNSFNIYWKQTDSQTISKITQGYNSNYYEIDELIPSESYTVWVSSVKNSGEHYSEPKETSTERGEPQEVTGVTVETLSDSVINVSWRKTLNPCQIRGYSVTWNGTALWNTFVKSSGSQDTTENTTSFDAENLTPYSDYWFYVSEISIDGIIGVTSEKSIARTNEGVAGPPEPVSSSPLSSSSVEVNWSPPYEQNGIITAYHTSCQLLPDIEDHCDLTTVSGVYSYTATSLQACGNYTFSVQAINGAGNGEAASSVSRTNPEQPPNFTNFAAVNVTSKTAFLSWDPLETTCPVLYYSLQGQGTVQWSEDTDTVNLILNIEENFYLLEHLIPYTSYSLTIKAATEGGTTDPISHEFKTLEGASAPPETVTSSSLTSSSVQVNWISPDEQNGVIVGYHTSCQLLPDTEDQCDITTTSDVYSCIATNLHECGNYTFSVQAINGAGYGEAASSISRTFPEQPPNFTNFDAVNVTSTTAFLAWEPLETTCPVLYYSLQGQGIVQWKEDTDTVNLILDIEENFYLLEHLIAWTSYSLTIKAITEGGTTNTISHGFTTLKDNPTEPMNLKVQNGTLTESEFTITWDNPTSKNGDFLQFKIGLYHGSDYLREIYSGYSASSQYHITFQQLDSETSYRVTVRAENEVGHSEDSELFVTTL